MKLEPVKFDPPSTKPIGKFTATLSPDGWVDAMYENTPSMRLTAGEVLECSRFINGFIKECDTQDAFQKYVRKHGETMGSTTSALFYRGDSLDYVVMVLGYSITVTPHRKDDA